MKAEFSEFSFGFGFTYTLLRNLSPGIFAAPQFPSLPQEASVAYDAKVDFLGLPLFFQFKLSDYLKHPLAREWSDYLQPYFRFEIMPLQRSPQHNLLRAIAEVEERVYYVSPLFNSIAEFNQSFRKESITKESIWVPVSELPYVADYDGHCLTYTTPFEYVWRTSDRQHRRGDYSGERAATEIQRRFTQRDLQRISRPYVSGLRSHLLRILRERGARPLPDLPVDFGPDVEGVRDISYLLTTFFGCELVVLRAR